MILKKNCLSVFSRMKIYSKNSVKTKVNKYGTSNKNIAKENYRKEFF